jgi:hypothetical protein
MWRRKGDWPVPASPPGLALTPGGPPARRLKVVATVAGVEFVTVVVGVEFVTVVVGVGIVGMVLLLP